jgi:hypothetical protein
VNIKRFERLERILSNFVVDLDRQKIVNKKTGKEKVLRIDKKGYYVLTFSEKNKSYGFSLHEIIGYKIFGKQIINKVINHLDGIKTNNHPKNLEVTDAFGNMKHAFNQGLLDNTGIFKTGQDHPLTRLNDDDVIEMRRLYVETDFHSGHIAEKFGISQSLAIEIITGRHWSHIPNFLDADFKSLKIEKYKKWSPKGEKRVAAKLTEEDVISIRTMYRNTDITMKDLGKKFGVKDNTVSGILTGSTWAHIPFPEDWDYNEIRKQKKLINQQRAYDGKRNKLKFSADDIDKIRKMYALGKYTQKEIANMFNTTSGRISDIINYKAYKK